MASLIDRANEAGIEAIALSPRLGDFNEDLRTLGIDALRAAIAGADRSGGRRSFHGTGGMKPEREVMPRRRRSHAAFGSRCFPALSERTAPTAF